jgi:rod shape-determining protein MreD
MLTAMAIGGIIAGLLLPTCALGCRIVGVHPDLLMVVAVSWCLLRGKREALVFAAFGGLAADMQSSGPLGLLTAATVAATLAASIGEINVFRSVVPLPYVTILAASALYYVVIVIGVLLTGKPLMLGRLFTTSMVPVFVLNLLFMLPTHWLAQRVSEILPPSTADWSS